MTDQEIVLYRDDIVHGYDFLLRQSSGVLTEKQIRRLREIWMAVLFLSNSVDEYVSARRHPRNAVNEFDPRYRLMYASRTPLQMIHVCVHLLVVNHVQRVDQLDPAQWDAIQLIEQAERGLVISIECLWTEMKHERRYQQFAPAH